MQIHISGHQVETGAAFQQYITDKIQEVVTKYFKNAVRADVKISKQTSMYRTDIIINEGTGIGITIKSDGLDPEPYRSFDCALHKLENQLRKYKDKIKRHKKPHDHFSMHMTKYVIEPFAEELRKEEINNIEEIEDVVEQEGAAPAIIGEKQVEMKKISVSNAIMHMDLENLPAYLFINIMTNKVNLVYYRKDGNISWVDTNVNVDTSGK